MLSSTAPAALFAILNWPDCTWPIFVDLDEAMEILTVSPEYAPT